MSLEVIPSVSYQLNSIYEDSENTGIINFTHFQFILAFTYRQVTE
jgi:hypothetical protein